MKTRESQNRNSERNLNSERSYTDHSCNGGSTSLLDQDETEDLQSEEYPILKSTTQIANRRRRSPQKIQRATQKSAPCSTPVVESQATSTLYPQSPASENSDLLWVGVSEDVAVTTNSLLESRLKGSLNHSRIYSTQRNKTSKSSKAYTKPHCESPVNGNNTCNSNNNNNNSHSYNNNILVKDICNKRKSDRKVGDEFLLRGRESLDIDRVEESYPVMVDVSVGGQDLQKTHFTEGVATIDNRVSAMHTDGAVRRLANHREDRREKKAKVKLKMKDEKGVSPPVCLLEPIGGVDISKIESLEAIPCVKTFEGVDTLHSCEEESSAELPKFTDLKGLTEINCLTDEVEEKKRKKDDKSKRKKLKHLQEENLSKRLYESREIPLEEHRGPINLLSAGTPQLSLPLSPEGTYNNEANVVNPRSDEERRGVLRLKACGECGARHVGGGCPYTRPTQRLPDSCSIPSADIPNHHPQNGVIVAPPHRETPVNLSNGSNSGDNCPEETWRSPQRPGSPGCYCRASLPSGLALEMRPVTLSQESSQEDNDDVGVMGVHTPPTKDIEVVVAQVLIGRYTQLGPVVGVQVKEKDIPDDFCMVNLWEVFGSEGKRYLSTVDPKKSNWVRFLRPAPDRDSANLVVVPRHLHDSDMCNLDAADTFGVSSDSVGGVAVFLITAKDINAGEELMFWAHDPTLAWSRKKMEKTNCGGCNMRFSHPLYYRMHCSVFHDPNYSLTIRKYHCKVCGLAVLGKENIMRHAAEQHEGRGAYQCQFCKKFFLRLHSLDMHVTYSCGRNPARVFPLCDYCGKKFCQPQHLRSHQKRMHADMAEVLREFQCKLCLKILGSRAALQRHLKEVHHKDLSTGATCDRCGKMFQNKSNLKIHMLTHSGVKPFRCIESACNAAFTTKQCLQFHYKKVHGYSGDSMPQIERCIPYTFDSYSGGMVPDPGRGKVPNPNQDPQSPQLAEAALIESDEGLDTSLPTDEEELPLTTLKPCSPSPPSRTPELILSAAKLPPAATLHGYVAKYAAAATRLVSKGSRKWLGDSFDSFDKEQEDANPNTPRDIYAFDDRIDSELSPHRKKEKLESKMEEDKLFRRESNASLLVEAALNVAENTVKGETRSVGTHDRLLSYAGGGSSAAHHGRYSPTPSIGSGVDHLLPHETALSTHIKYTATTDDDRGHLEYTLEREYDPRDLPEVMVVHDGIGTRELNESLSHDLQDNFHSTLEHLPPASVGESELHEVHGAHNLTLTKAELTSNTPVTSSDPNTSDSVLEPTLHVLDQLPAAQGLPVSLSSSLNIGLDMTYKHYRLVPESSLSAAISHDHLLNSAPLDDQEGSIGLETITSSGEVNHQMSPRHDHLSDQMPLPELQPHDFRGLQNMRSPSRSPYLSPSHTPEEALRSYLIPADGLRSPHSSEQGIDMSRGNFFIRSSELPGIAYRYQSDSTNSRGAVYELERPPSHSMDLSLVGRSISYAEEERSPGQPTVYMTETRAGSTPQTVYLSDDRDLRHSLDLTLPRVEESNSRAVSPLSHARSTSPQPSPHDQLSPSTQLSPTTTQLLSYSQLSPHSQISPHSQLSPLPQVTLIDRSEADSPDVGIPRDVIEEQSPGPSSSISIPAGTPLPPISRIVAASPHSFYSARQLIPVSRQDISISVPTHIYTESYVITSGANFDQQPPTPGPTPPSSASSNSKDRTSPYLQYPSSPYGRQQELASPPPGFHYQYY